MVEAWEVSEILKVEPVFKTNRIRRKKQIFNYKHPDEASTDPEKRFQVEFSNPLLGQGI